MDLFKHIVFILQIIACTNGFMNVYEDDVNTRNKRSPADSFSLFGLNPRLAVPSTISLAKQSIGTIGNLFTPHVHQIRNEENFQKPFKTSNDVNNYKRRPFDISTPTNQIQNTFVRENINKSLVGESVKPNRFEKYNNSEDKTMNDRIKQEKDTTISKHNKENHEKENITSNPTDDVMEIDENVLNYIFQTSTEEASTDYTTDTTGYENSTSDELLRIPSAALATLLGK